MFFLMLIGACGLIAGFLLLRTVPLIPQSLPPHDTGASVTIIIPARNEELNLPALLSSLPNPTQDATKIIVVDDGSTDSTALVAAQHGATVLTSLPLPRGWTGKNWACHQGAQAASTEILFFLDADTRFVGGGYARILQYFAALRPDAALSLLPFHHTALRYEELSLFFNILMAMGAGGFAGLDAPHLFGPSLLIRKDLYDRAGGHRAVRKHILENFNFASFLIAAGGEVYTFGGSGTLETRMFPHGQQQLLESWQKAFASGAGATSTIVLGLSIGWLASAMLTFLLLFAAHRSLWFAAAALYVLYACQIAWFGKQLGSFRWLTAAAYPVALVFYFAVFGQSLWIQAGRRSSHWRGREI